MTTKLSLRDWCFLVETHMLNLRPSLIIEEIRENRGNEWVDLYIKGIIPFLAALNFVLDTYESDVAEVERKGKYNEKRFLDRNVIYLLSDLTSCQTKSGG